MNFLKRLRSHIEAIIIRSINRHDYLHDKLDEIRNVIIVENEKNRNLARFHHLKDYTLTFYYQGKRVKLYIPNADTDDIQSQIIASNNFYEEDFLSLLRSITLDRAGNVIDVGANIGNHSIFFSNICDFKKCISIEPNPQVFEILQKNIALNNLEDKVEALNCGAGKEKSVSYLGKSNARNLGATSLNPQDKTSKQVEIIAIDELGLDSLDLLKIDVEGMAVEVISGATETLMKYKPIVFVELFEHEFDDGQRILDGLGYSITHSLDWDYYIFQVTK